MFDLDTEIPNTEMMVSQEIHDTNVIILFFCQR